MRKEMFTLGEICNPINPLEISPPEIEEKHKEWLNSWSYLSYCVRDVINTKTDSPYKNAMMWTITIKVGDPIKKELLYRLRELKRIYQVNFMEWEDEEPIRYHFANVLTAYVGYNFIPLVEEWKEHYPFQPVINLWKQGLIPSFDGNQWRLHGGKRMRILWEGERVNEIQ